MLAVIIGLLVASTTLLATDGSVTVTATSPAPNPVCLGSVVMASFSGSATNPTDSACEITITNRIWNWTAVDDANHTIAPNQNGGTSATFSWTPGSCGTNKTLAATATVTFQGTNCHGAFSTNYSGSTSARVTAVQLQSISVSGATQIDATNWADVKTTNADDYVTITANLCPNDTNAATLLSWTNGQPVPGNPFQRRVSKTNSVETTVTASCCNTSLTVNVWIVWSSFTKFNNTGPKDTDSDVYPLTFGTIQTLHNGTLMQVTITPSGFGAFSSVSYDIKRTKERATWRKDAGAPWKQDNNHVGPGEDDDTLNGVVYNDDEDLTPSSSDHIYSEDWPGFGLLSAVPDEVVYKASFIEWNTIGLGGWKRCSDDYPWHSITWLENTGSGWQRKAGASNEIAPGAITVGTAANP